MKIWWIALCASLIYSESAHAFCRRSACEGKPAKVCVPAQPDDCGMPARWTEKPIAYDVAAPAPGALDYSAAIERGFAQWAAADCGDGRRPSLAIVAHVVPTPETTPARGRVLVGETPDDPREGKLALTQVRFSPKTGVVIGARTTFYAQYLQRHDAAFLDALALHEAGHFLGLIHSNDASAVMAAEAHDGAQPRTGLAADDVAAVCAMFPPAGAPRAGTPRMVIFAAVAPLVALLGCLLAWWSRRRWWPRREAARKLRR